ncbi:MAG: FAD:protein FMN transferase [Myxococcota bacterium]|nr:FAD:protein FMN transferase [Myxococcota bacterium]
MVGLRGQQPQLQVGRGDFLIARAARAWLLAVGLALLAAPTDAARFQDGRIAMGTLFEVTIEAPSERLAREAAEACYAEAERLEALLSRWRPDSQVSKLNASAGGAALPVHPDVLSLLADAKALGRQTRGSFDVTVGPLIALWTAAGERDRLPTQAEIDATREKVGVEAIEVEGGRARLARPGMSIDLGGVAKGWALDRMETLLRARGIERALLSFGQSSLIGIGAPEGEPGWRVLVRGPGGDFAGVAVLRDTRLSISGSFGRSSEIAGRRFGHVLDPRTGWPVDHEAIAVVEAGTAAQAEAFSKALLVLPAPDAIAAMEAQQGVEGLWMGAEASQETAGFRAAVGFEAAPSE